MVVLSARGSALRWPRWSGLAALTLMMATATLPTALGKDTNGSLYTVVAPYAVRAHSDFHVAVTVRAAHGAEPADTDVHLELADGEHTYGADVRVPANSTKLARIQVGELSSDESANVTLRARGQGGAHFDNKTAVAVQRKRASLLLQTDKPQYKPGHAVNVRVLALDPHLRPAGETLDVHVTDGKGNRVAQWRNVSAVGGVWSASMPLSEQPVLGEWTLTANLADRGTSATRVSKNFLVAEYVLPVFQVTASAPSKAVFSQGKMTCTVKAEYTFGQPVVGFARVRASVPYSNIYRPVPMPVAAEVSNSNDTSNNGTIGAGVVFPPLVEVGPKAFEKVVPIDGTATVEFDIKNELKIEEVNYWMSVVFEASVEEGLSGRRQNASSVETAMYLHDYTVEFTNTSNEFQPGEKFTVKVNVSHLLDGSPVRDGQSPVTLSYAAKWDDPEAWAEKTSLPTSGVATFELDTKTTDEFLTIRATYLNKTEQFFVRKIYKNEPDPDTLFDNMRVELVTQKPKVGDEVEVRVRAKEAVSAMAFAVLGPLDVELADVVQVAVRPGNADAANNKTATTTTALRFRATAAMAPSSRLLVHGFTAGGELVAESLDLDVEPAASTVGVAVRPSRAQPGDGVEVQLSAPRRSRIALLAVDKSVLLQGEGLGHGPPRHDVSADDVRSERLSYANRYYSWAAWGSAASAFSSAGAAFMTNAEIKVPDYSVMYSHKGGVFPMASAFAGGMPMAASALGGFAGAAGAGGSSSAAPPPRLRKRFPETWLWEDLDMGESGNLTLKRFAPDTITSWVVSALAVDPETGLLLSERAELTVFRPFFVSLHLPYSVIRGETVAVPVLVFNYLDEAVTADVTLADSDDFDVDPKNGTEGGRTRRVAVDAQRSATATFHIKPKRVGEATLRATATSAGSGKAGDAVERKLRVKAEGETRYRNKVIPVDLRREKKLKTTVTLDVPKDIVPDSENVEVSAVGDILGPSASNLDGLLRMPFGCGEQNMLNFVPNIVILDYLKLTRQNSPAIERQARNFIEVGYQRELTYRHKDGSFSAFGESDKSGSTWLTAFVAKSFQLARPHAELVEQRVVDEALRWLAGRQAPNGSFPEAGTVSHRDMQGGAAKGLALTAYVLTAFLASKSATDEHQDVVKKTLDYVVSNLDGQDDPYALTICAYALQLAGHPAKDKAFEKLETKATTQGGQKWWSRTRRATPPAGGYGADFEPSSVDVEMTAYALMTLLRRGAVEDALPVMQWLLAQRNSNGGFASTQDTVVGLQALAAMAERISFEPGDMRVTFSHGGGNATAIAVDRGNSMLLQKRELPRKVREVGVSAEGSGFALVQVSWSYNEADAAGRRAPPFTLRALVDNSTDTSLLKLDVCTSLAAGGAQTNMVLLELALPSGFAADEDTLADLRAHAEVRRVETKDQATAIVLYFDKLESKEYCVPVVVRRTHSVFEHKPVPITVYDYYDKNRRTSVYYEPPHADVKDKSA